MAAGLVGLRAIQWVDLATLREPANRSSVLVLNERGEPIVRWAMPNRSRLVEATSTQVWLVEHDDDDLQRIVRYSVRCDGRACSGVPPAAK